jgi:hypothetical protein
MECATVDACGFGRRAVHVDISRCAGLLCSIALLDSQAIEALVRASLKTASRENICTAVKRNRAPEKKKGLRRKACKPSNLLVGRTGFEPVTNGLKVRCSTS